MLGPKSCKVVLPAGGPGNKGRFEASEALGTASRVAWRSSGQLLGGARPLGPGLPCSESPDAVGRAWLAGPQGRAWWAQEGGGSIALGESLRRREGPFIAQIPKHIHLVKILNV